MTLCPLYCAPYAVTPRLKPKPCPGPAVPLPGGAATPPGNPHPHVVLWNKEAGGLAELSPKTLLSAVVEFFFFFNCHHRKTTLRNYDTLVTKHKWKQPYSSLKCQSFKRG